MLSAEEPPGMGESEALLGQSPSIPSASDTQRMTDEASCLQRDDRGPAGNGAPLSGPPLTGAVSAAVGATGEEVSGTGSRPAVSRATSDGVSEPGVSRVEQGSCCCCCSVGEVELLSSSALGARPSVGESWWLSRSKLLYAANATTVVAWLVASEPWLLLLWRSSSGSWTVTEHSCGHSCCSSGGCEPCELNESVDSEGCLREEGWYELCARSLSRPGEDVKGDMWECALLDFGVLGGLSW